MTNRKKLIKQFEKETGLEYEYTFYDQSQPYYAVTQKRERKDEYINWLLEKLEKKAE